MKGKERNEKKRKEKQSKRKKRNVKLRKERNIHGSERVCACVCVSKYLSRLVCVRI